MILRKRTGFLLFIALVILFSATSLAEYEQYRLTEPYELYTGPYTTVYPIDSHNVIVRMAPRLKQYPGVWNGTGMAGSSGPWKRPGTMTAYLPPFPYSKQTDPLRCFAAFPGQTRKQRNIRR